MCSKIENSRPKNLLTINFFLLLVFLKQITKIINQMAQEMLAGVKTQEVDQAGQVPLQKLKALSQWTGNSCLSTLRIRNYLNSHFIHCR